MEEIPACLSLTCDQTGIRIVPSSPWIMERQGARRAEMIGSGDKRKITVVFPGSLVGDLYKGKQLNVILNSNSLGPWLEHYTHAPQHWSKEKYSDGVHRANNYTVCERIQATIQKEKQAAVIVMENFKRQITDAVFHLLEANSIHVCLSFHQIPPIVCSPWT